MAYRELKERSWRCNMELSRRNLIKYTFGNASAFDVEKRMFAIKPSGVPYDELQPTDMVVVDLDNKVVEGTLKFSSDTKTHTVLYRKFPGIAGVVHTHSPYATAWAQAMKSIPVLGTTHADHCTRPVPCTPVMSNEMIKGDYEEETGNLIVDTFEKNSFPHREIEMVLVACHGPFTWGETPEKAVYNSVILEELARIAFLTLRIDPGVPPMIKELIDKHYLRKHGESSYYGQTK